MSEPRGLLRRSAAQTGSRATALLFNAVAFALVARILSVDELASYAAALALYSISTTVAELGLQPTLVLQLSENEGRERSVLRSGLVVAAAAAATTMAIAGVLAMILLSSQAQLALVLMLPAFLAVRLASPFLALRQHQLRMARIAGADVLGSAVVVSVLLAVIAASPDGAEARFVSVGGAMFAGAVGALLVLAGRPAPDSLQGPVPSPWATARRSFPLGVTNALSFIHVRVDQLVLAGFGLSVALAEYAVAYRMIDAGLALAAGLATVSLPMLAKAHSPDERRALAADLGALVQVVGLAGGLTLFWAAPFVVRAIGGAEYEGSAWLLRLLCPVLVLSVLNLAGNQVAIVEGQATKLLRLSAITVVLNVGLNLLLVPHIEAYGAIAATFTTELLGAVAVGQVARAALPGSVALRPWLFLGAGAAIATFGALAVWHSVAPAAGIALAVAGTTLALLPLSRAALASFRRLASDRSVTGPTWVGDDMR